MTSAARASDRIPAKGVQRSLLPSVRSEAKRRGRWGLHSTDPPNRVGVFCARNRRLGLHADICTLRVCVFVAAVQQEHQARTYAMFRSRGHQ